jgi:hypothetical protein
MGEKRHDAANGAQFTRHRELQLHRCSPSVVKPLFGTDLRHRRAFSDILVGLEGFGTLEGHERGKSAADESY